MSRRDPGAANGAVAVEPGWCECGEIESVHKPKPGGGRGALALRLPLPPVPARYRHPLLPRGVLMPAHEMAIVREEQRKRGWFLSWRCTAGDCDAYGNATVPSQETARALFRVVALGHQRSEEA